MSATNIAVEVLASQPCRILLGGLAHLQFGRRVLNKFSCQRGVFNTFEEAWTAAGIGRYAGHDHPDDIALHFELSRNLRASDYAVLYWLTRLAAPDGSVKLFDFGGNAGNLFYSYLPYLKNTGLQANWTVFDLPAVTAEGRRIAAAKGAAGLRFTDSVNDGSDANILLVSGALHYWEKSLQAFVKQFSSPPEHIILNRTPIHETEASFITVQRTDSYAVPCIVRNSVELVSSFAGMGYAVVDRWLAHELKLRMPLFPKRTVPHYSGFYFRRYEMT